MKICKPAVAAALLLLSGAGAHAAAPGQAAKTGHSGRQACAITVAGAPMACNPPAFFEGSDAWAPADDAARALSITLKADANSFAVTPGSKKVARKAVDGQDYVSMYGLAEALNASAVRGSNSLSLLARITDVRYAGGQIRVATSLPVRYEVKRLSSPERIYIDFPNTVLVGGSNETRSKSSNVKALRVGQAGATTARVTAETVGRLDFSAISPQRSESIAVTIRSPGGLSEPKTASTGGSSDPAPTGPLTIKDVRLDTADGIVRVVISTDRPASPELGQRLSEGQLWLDFSPAVVVSADRQWNVAGQLLQSMRLDSFPSSPPRSRLVAETRRLLVSRIKAGSSPNELVWEMSVPDGSEQGLRGTTVIIDPGHGGKDTGATGNALREKDINLAIGLATAEEARNRGLNPVLTRDSDVFVSLGYRTDQIKPNNASLFVSIHSNSNTRANSTSGTEVYYHNQEPNSRALAQIVHDKITAATDMPARGARSDTKLYRTGLFVLRNSSVPAILVEVGYVNHARDASRLGDADFQKQVARAIVDGISVYLGAPVQAKGPLRPGLGLGNYYASAGQAYKDR
ncbi:MAG: N-acetylmuramoyl-L-alanine amidase [Armatimonadetes bacterium]|nr:N-acetylmuramoyl-L-alanine amidase [Armatimonadota bacterium]